MPASRNKAFLPIVIDKPLADSGWSGIATAPRPAGLRPKPLSSAPLSLFHRVNPL